MNDKDKVLMWFEEITEILIAKGYSAEQSYDYWTTHLPSINNNRYDYMEENGPHYLKTEFRYD